METSVVIFRVSRMLESLSPEINFRVNDLLVLSREMWELDADQ